MATKTDNNTNQYSGVNSYNMIQLIRKAMREYGFQVSDNGLGHEYPMKLGGFLICFCVDYNFKINYNGSYYYEFYSRIYCKSDYGNTVWYKGKKHHTFDNVIKELVEERRKMRIDMIENVFDV